MKESPLRVKSGYQLLYMDGGLLATDFVTALPGCSAFLARKVDTRFFEQVLGSKVIPGRNTRRKLFTGSITSASVDTLWQGVIHAQAF